MLNKIKKIGPNVKGFTLTEVMIGMMILTVAIVSASNLLTGIISSNRNNLTTMQAYYLAQEGLEVVRNVRDTNWLHNRDWLGAASKDFWGVSFEIPQNSSDANNYAVKVERAGFNVPKDDKITGLQQIFGYKPWTIEKNDGGARIYRHESYLDSNAVDSEDTGFKRTIVIKKYDCKYLGLQLCKPGKENDYVLVQAKIEWDLGAKQRDLLLSEVLSNWKGGVL